MSRKPGAIQPFRSAPDQRSHLEQGVKHSQEGSRASLERVSQKNWPAPDVDDRQICPTPTLRIGNAVLAAFRVATAGPRSSVCGQVVGQRYRRYGYCTALLCRTASQGFYARPPFRRLSPSDRVLAACSATRKGREHLHGFRPAPWQPQHAKQDRLVLRSYALAHVLSRAPFPPTLGILLDPSKQPVRDGAWLHPSPFLPESQGQAGSTRWLPPKHVHASSQGARRPAWPLSRQ